MSRSGQRRRPTAIDLFAGAGGLSLGIEQAGFDLLAAVEYDPIHMAIHHLNFPMAMPICADVRGIRGDDVRAATGLGDGELDLLFGGPPCQGFSLIGHRVLDDPRNELVFHFLRLVGELQPRTFLMENVPGMATGRHTALLDELIEGFSLIGYRLRLPWRILNAGNFGVPQDRRRLILVGARSDVQLPEYPTLITSFPRRGHIPDEEAALPPGPTVADSLSDLPEIEDFPNLLEIDELNIRLTGGSRYARVLRGDLTDAEDRSYPRIRSAGTLSGCLRARHTERSRTRFAGTAPGTTEPVSRFFRLPLDGVSNTLRAGTASDRGAFSAPRPIHPISARCISVREAARLHSYPDWFRFHKTIWHGFRQIGNSVPPLLGRAVGSQLMKALGAPPIAPHNAVPLGPSALATMDMGEAAAHFGVSRHVIAPRRRSSVGV